VLSKIKIARMKQDNPVSKLESLDLPNPVSKKGKLQPLSPSTANTLEDDHKADRLLRNDDSRMKLKYGNVAIDEILKIKRFLTGCLLTSQESLVMQSVIKELQGILNC